MTMLAMVFGPVMLSKVVSSVFETHQPGFLGEPASMCTVTASVNPATSMLLLLLSGDVEVNPGPQTTEETPFARSMRLGLASLLVGAPDKVHEVLSVWSSLKPGNEIISL